MEEQKQIQEPCEATLVNYNREEDVSEYKPYDIHISHLHYGYVVEVGCQRISVEKTEDLINSLSEYLRNPEKMTKLYRNKEWFNKK